MDRTTADAHILVSLTYVSRANAMSTKVINELLQHAQKSNVNEAITGMLIFNNDYFLQTIEGSRTAVNRLLHLILADTRHHDIQVLDHREISCREWGQWSMNYATGTQACSAIYLKYSTTAAFNPYLLSAESARQLMVELSQSQKVSA